MIKWKKKLCIIREIIFYNGKIALKKINFKNVDKAAQPTPSLGPGLSGCRPRAWGGQTTAPILGQPLAMGPRCGRPRPASSASSYNFFKNFNLVKGI